MRSIQIMWLGQVVMVKCLNASVKFQIKKCHNYVPKYIFNNNKITNIYKDNRKGDCQA